MIIKTFRSDSSASALKRVRMEMGGDAIVLKTTQETGANSRLVYEITACIENPTVAQSSMLLNENKVAEETIPLVPEQIDATKTAKETTALPKEERLGNLGEIDKKIEEIISQHLAKKEKYTFGIFQSVYEKLNEGDFDKTYLDNFVKTLSEEYDQNLDIETFALEKLTAEFEKVTSEPIEFKKGDKIIFIGPSGCGKSSVLGKIAASLVFEKKQKVKLLSLDDFKMAAYDEIAAYADILGIDFNDDTSVENINNDKAITLIDSPSTPIENKKTENLKKKIELINPNYSFVVLSALIRSRDIKHLCRMTSEYNPTHIVITKTDLTQSFGAVLTAAHATGLKIIFLNSSPGSIGKLSVLNSKEMANTLLQKEDDCE